MQAVKDSTAEVNSVVLAKRPDPNHTEPDRACPTRRCWTCSTRKLKSSPGVDSTFFFVGGPILISALFFVLFICHCFLRDRVLWQDTVQTFYTSCVTVFLVILCALLQPSMPHCPFIIPISIAPTIFVVFVSSHFYYRNPLVRMLREETCRIYQWSKQCEDSIDYTTTVESQLECPFFCPSL